MLGFSILICTYNPAFDLLERLFDSIKNLKFENFEVEIIVVDNNSFPALATLPHVHNLLAALPHAKLIHESTPGLTAARIAGIRAAQYDWIVFFDDDNEPDKTYLLEASKVIADNPEVVAWGPGNVEVEYTGQVDEWLQRNKTYFQQRNEQRVATSKELHWQACYPYGTGMLIQKKVAAIYANRVHQGVYTVSDRKGKDLSSGGDVQLVFTGIAMGNAAGVDPAIKIKHLIQPSKTSFSYLKKLVYGTASSYLIAFNQVYPENQIPFSATSNMFIVRQCWFHIRQYQKGKDRKDSLLKFINKLGEINAMYLAYSNRQKPFALRLFERLLIR